jgi:flagellar protein FliO/FliZ
MKMSWPRILGISLLLLILPLTSFVTANAENSYLTYKEPAANSTATSLSTFGYVLSLLLTFAIVVGLAYFTSKFLSQRLSPSLHSRNMLIRDVVFLGTNRALYLVEIANRIFLLGVTDHNITQLQEFTDENFIAELRTKDSNFIGQPSPTFQNVFQQQVETLHRMASRISGGGKTE